MTEETQTPDVEELSAAPVDMTPSPDAVAKVRADFEALVPDPEAHHAILSFMRDRIVEVNGANPYAWDTRVNGDGIILMVGGQWGVCVRRPGGGVYVPVMADQVAREDAALIEEKGWKTPGFSWPTGGYSVDMPGPAPLDLLQRLRPAVSAFLLETARHCTRSPRKLAQRLHDPAVTAYMAGVVGDTPVAPEGFDRESGPGSDPDDIARIVGMGIDDPRGADAFRRDSESARRVIEECITDADTRRVVLDAAAEAIRAAHNANPYSWGVTLYGGGVGFTVGGQTVLSFWRNWDQVPMMVTTAKVGDVLGQWLDTANGWSKEYGWPGGTRHIRIPKADILGRLPLARVARLDAVQRSAERADRKKGANSITRSYSPGVLEYLRAALGVEIPEPAYAPPQHALFTPRAFELLAGLAESGEYAYYTERREEFVDAVERPLQELLAGALAQLAGQLPEIVETQHDIFSRFNKNDFGKGGAWSHYWGALYPKGGKRTTGAQLYVFLDASGLDVGFTIGHYGPEAVDRFAANCKELGPELASPIANALALAGLAIGRGDSSDSADGNGARPDGEARFKEWLTDPRPLGPSARFLADSGACILASAEDMVIRTADAFRALMPLFLLAALEDPMPEVRKWLGHVGPYRNPPFPLSAVAAETFLPEDKLRTWVSAVHRKGQAVLYGPPGTGKTFVAERLAKHLIADGDGFWELVQFHPAYAYEDFIQGIRPETHDGVLRYPLAPGRFLDFVREAERRSDTCVLIIDEINRANLARVFGELMYLLEYRDRELPLAGGGTLRIPQNVRIIGTMNTADRSIALVDHALRRRFAFLHLGPEPDILSAYHAQHGNFDPKGLVTILQQVNGRINDHHYSLGVSFFMRPDIESEIEDIWRMEIEPYLEEYFFDRKSDLAACRWSAVCSAILPPEG